jgi:CheY-like chemotaxis protein
MATLPSQRILVVDDEPLVCESVKMMLVFDRHSVETAGGGFEGMAKFEPNRFDLVITDYCMPGMKGDLFAQVLKERAPDLPIIMLTAYPPATKPAAIDLVLTKPFYFDTLREALQKVLAKSQVA